MFNLTLSWTDQARLHFITTALRERNVIEENIFTPAGINISHQDYWFLVGWLGHHGFRGLAELLLQALD